MQQDTPTTTTTTTNVRADWQTWYIHCRSMNSPTHCGWLRGRPRCIANIYYHLPRFVSFTTVSKQSNTLTRCKQTQL